MVRWCVILCGLLVLLGAALAGTTSTERGVLLEKLSVDPGESMTYTTTFKGGKRASVIVISRLGIPQELRTPLGLYVFDQYGNCIARDDLGSPKTMDKLAVEWSPPQTAPYTIEVRNFGPLPGQFSVALR